MYYVLEQDIAIHLKKKKKYYITIHIHNSFFSSCPYQEKQPYSQMISPSISASASACTSVFIYHLKVFEHNTEHLQYLFIYCELWSCKKILMHSLNVCMFQLLSLILVTRTAVIFPLGNKLINSLSYGFDDWCLNYFQFKACTAELLYFLKSTQNESD